MVKEGKTLDQIKAALPDAPAPGAPAGGAAAAGAVRGAATPALTFVETAYQEITKAKKK